MTSSVRSSTPVPGRRSTKQRAAVVELLDQIDDFRSAQELHDELRKRGEGIGLTTVYRTLQSLADAGEIDVLRTGSGEAVYRRCSSHHHHHLVCRHCGFTVEVEGPAVERWADSTAAGNGFSDITHTVEIVGTCATCAAR
jgi:Fur family ferric uptake transcriptional regulator